MFEPGKKIVLAGGTGAIGKILSHVLEKAGYEIVILTRNKALRQQQETIKFSVWDGEHIGNWTDDLEGADTIINLSGQSIQRRFTTKNKEILTQSRLLPTQLLGSVIPQLKTPPRLWINFSGISIFDGLPYLQDERSTIFGKGFLAELSKKWEQTFLHSKVDQTIQTILRVSPVLSTQMGIFAELYPLVKSGLGGKVGHGQQMVSWIHETDLIDLILWIIRQENPSPVYHACSPHPVSNADFMEAFRDEAEITFGLPLPHFAARLGAFFKGVDANLLLQTVPGTTHLTTTEGFQFSFAYIHEALRDLIHKTKIK